MLDGPEARSAASVTDDETAPPPSAVRAAARPEASAAPVGASSFPMKDGKRYFEIDGELFELRPVRQVATAPKPRGLAAVSPERRAEISARGGRATAKSAKAVRHITSENAREVGRKGGLAKAARARDLSSAAE